MENTNNQELLAFLEANPNSNKEAIKAATKLNGLFLFNLLKRLVQEGKIAEHSDGDEKTYSLGDVKHEGIAPEHVKKEPVVKSSRDNSKLNFNGQEYGKGPLVRAVVAQHITDNPTVTYDELKDVFRNELLKRFGIFQDEPSLKEIAPKGSRYFTKPEHAIKLADRDVFVCSQFTLDNIQPFLAKARELGYVIN